MKSITKIENEQVIMSHHLKASDLFNQGSVDACYDTILFETDKAFREGRFSDVDDALQTVDVGRLPLEVLLVLFTATRQAKDYLPSRKTAYEIFVQRAKHEDHKILLRNSVQLREENLACGNR